MNKINITGTGGYEIPCAHTLTGGEHTVVIVSHGFGSTKESSTALMLAHGMAGHGAGVGRTRRHIFDDSCDRQNL